MDFLKRNFVYCRECKALARSGPATAVQRPYRAS